jgi:hypothetical protein
VKKPTKKELREISDHHLLTNYNIASDRAERAIRANDILPGYSVQVLKIQEQALSAVDAYREEILRRMGGVK